MLDATTLAYVAGVVDLHGVIRTRVSGDSLLPQLSVNGPNTAMLTFLGDLTGTRAIVRRRQYSKAGCSEHCGEKHQHVVSVSGTWSVSGAKATIVLWNIRPFMRLQVEAATSAVVQGLDAPIKPATLTKMFELGWDLPEF